MHSPIGVSALNFELLGLCALNYRAITYSTTQRHDSTLWLNTSWLISFHSLDDVPLHLEPRSIYTIPWFADHG